MGFCYQVGSETGGLNLKNKERRISEVRLAASLLGNPSRLTAAVGIVRKQWVRGRKVGIMKTSQDSGYKLYLPLAMRAGGGCFRWFVTEFGHWIWRIEEKGEDMYLVLLLN